MLFDIMEISRMIIRQLCFLKHKSHTWFVHGVFKLWKKPRWPIKRISRKIWKIFKSNSASLMSLPSSMVNTLSELTLDSFQVWSSFWTSPSRLLLDSSPNSSFGRLKPKSPFPSASSWPSYVSSTPHWFSFGSIETMLMNGSTRVDWFMKLMFS